LYHPAAKYQPSIVDRWQEWLHLPAMNQYVMQEVVEAGFDGNTIFKQRLPIKVGVIGLIVVSSSMNRPIHISG
jgi:hypothetical protein